MPKNKANPCQQNKTELGTVPKTHAVYIGTEHHNKVLKMCNELSVGITTVKPGMLIRWIIDNCTEEIMEKARKEIHSRS
ncbi:hypothetical protein [Pantoea ananatis]|uniref:hypothetical protein n=1 Tax=Pantoea ananas TaxID=553 RepID=UPI001B300812|nr:hypothetical protein [Pantoea ananatis]